MAQAPGKGSRITGSQRSELAGQYAERYAGGESIRSIATEGGRSFGFVHGVLKESGVELRGRGGATRGVKSAIPSSPGKKAAVATTKKASTTKTAKAPTAKKAATTKTAKAPGTRGTLSKAVETVKQAAKKASTTKTAKAPSAKKASTTKTAKAPSAKKASTTKTAKAPSAKKASTTKTAG